MTNPVNFKNYAIITLIFALLLQSWRLNSVKHERDLTVEKMATLQSVIAQSEMAYKQQTDRLRLREQEAAASARQSRRRMDGIMNQKVPKDCEEAIAWMIPH